MTCTARKLSEGVLTALNGFVIKHQRLMAAVAAFAFGVCLLYGAITARAKAQRGRLSL